MTGQEKTRGGSHRCPIGVVTGADLPDVPAAVGVAPWGTHVRAGGRATPSAAPGTAADPFRAVLAAMRSAGLISGRPAQPDRGTGGGS